MKEKDWAELFGSDWPRIKRYGSAIVNADDKQVFWDSIREAKRQDPHWSFESVQPTKRSATEKAMHACCEHIKSLKRLPEVKDADMRELQGGVSDGRSESVEDDSLPGKGAQHSP